MRSTIRIYADTRSCYMTEGGFWAMTDEDAKGLRGYLLKGGFAIFDDFRDDFRGAGWDHFDENMHRVLPEAQDRRYGSGAPDLSLVF